MIKLISCKKKNYKKKLKTFLEKRRLGRVKSNLIVSKILNDIKKNKIKALLKYEKRFSKNKNLIPTKKEINNAIKLLDPKIKKAIDFAYNRILKFHYNQKVKDILYIDLTIKL